MSGNVQQPALLAEMMQAMPVPTISVIMPVFNEAKHIQQTLICLQSQTVPGHRLEFLLVDGGSTDGTRETIAQYATVDRRFQLLHNPQRKTPAALNIGLHASQGVYVCIMGAHASYPSDYIAVCLAELQARGAVGCSGRLTTLPANDSLGARLSAWCMAHPFASSGNSVRTHPGGFVDTVPYPLFIRQALIDAHGYDEQLERNQDNDMNQRLRSAGHKLYLTPMTQAGYYARDGVRSLLAYAFRTGRWNGITFHHDPLSMSPRHFAPFGFVGLLVIAASFLEMNFVEGRSLVVPRAALLGLVGFHFLMGTVAGLQVAIRERSWGALLLPFVMLGFHVAYGAGTVAGLLSKPAMVKRTAAASTAAQSGAVGP